MKKTLKDRIQDLGLSYTKEMLVVWMIVLISLGGGFAIYYFLKETIIAVSVAVIGLALVGYYLTRYSKLERKMEKGHVDEFISLLSYFEIFISNHNNVYTSFRMLLPYCSVFMDDAINSLLNQIDVDKTVGPYINFAAKFKNRIIESLMVSIYQMVDNGETINQFSEFDLLFANVREKYQEDLIDSKKKSLEALNSFPLIGAGAITISLSLSIISIIGDFVNVI